MAVDGMVDDMKAVTQLVKSQVTAGMKEDDVKETMCRSWVGRLQQQHGLRDQHKSALTDAISEGPWTHEQKKLLATTVLASGVKASRKASDRRPNQKAPQIESLLPVECMSNLRDTTKYSMISRLSILARSVKALGIENPDNITLFRLVCIVAYCDPKLSFDQADTWRHMTTLQKYIKAGGNSTVQYIVDYPPSSALLPQDIQKSAYGSSGLPPELDWRELDHILADQKARGDRHAKSSSSNAGKTKVIPQHASDQPLPLQHSEQTPLPSPDTWRLRAGSSILSSPASETAASVANTDGATGHSEHICSLCRKPMDGTHEHHETAPTEGEIPKPHDDGVNGLDAFELGMRQAATAKKDSSKLKRPAAASASLKRPAAAGKKPVAGASTGSTPKKSVAGASTGRKPKKPVPGWSTARRLKTYPKGCSKCAHKVPGCTLSCFRARGEA